MDGEDGVMMAAVSPLIGGDEIARAHQMMAPYIPETPLIYSHYLSAKYGASIYLKLENLNLAGSFKIRGAAYSLLSHDITALQKQGVVTASAGNHGRAVAYMAYTLKIPATIFMPRNTPLIKVSATQSLGAKVYIRSETFSECEQAAQDWNAEHHAIYIHGFQDPHVIAGQASVGLEILQRLPQVDAMIAPVGGGGLMAGMICAVQAKQPQVQLYGVQSAFCCPVSQHYRSQGGACELQQSHHMSAQEKGTSLADGITIKVPGSQALALIKRYVQQMFCVSEQAVAGAIMELLEREHLMAEGAGAVSVAALERVMRYQQARLKGKQIVCVVSGGNIDISLLSRITHKGLLYSHRMLRFKLLLPDHPGALSRCLEILSQQGANLYNITHNRIFSDHGVKKVEVLLELEISSQKHGQSLMQALAAQGYTPQQT